MATDLLGLEELAFSLGEESLIEGVNHEHYYKQVPRKSTSFATMPPHQPINLKQLPSIYYALYWFGVATFAAANLFTLPCFDMDIAAPLFSLFMQISTVLMAMVELTELIVDPVPKWSTAICIINLVGLSSYGYSAFIYEELNKGEIYLLGAFCFSLGY